MKSKFVHLRYYPGETGWGSVVSTDPLHIRIENVTYGGKFNLGDVVTVKTDFDGTMIADKRISRKYSRRVAIFYDTVPQFRKLTEKLRKNGSASEGVTPPDREGRGVMIVAFNKPVNPAAVAKSIGIEKPTKQIK